MKLSKEITNNLELIRVPLCSESKCPLKSPYIRISSQFHYIGILPYRRVPIGVLTSIWDQIRVPSCIRGHNKIFLWVRFGPQPAVWRPLTYGFIYNLFLAFSIGSTLLCCPTLQNVGRLLVVHCMRWIQRPIRQQREEAFYWSHEEDEACRSEALCVTPCPRFDSGTWCS